MRLAALTPLVLLGACYSYAPIEPTSVPVGVGVRARVSPAGAQRISPLIGGSDARVLAGTVIDNASGSLVVEVPMVVRAGVGNTFETLNQRVSIPRADLVEVETRRLSRSRTSLVVGAAAVIVGTTAINALKGKPGKEATPGGTSSDSRRPR